MDIDVAAMAAVQDECVAQLAAILRERGKAAALREAADAGKDANALLHHLDDLFDDGGQWRCEQIVDPIVEELIDNGISFERVDESGEYVEYCEAVVMRAVEMLRI